MDMILGQPRATAFLQTQLAGDRMHHACIFHGPLGVGKCTTALALARVLLCHARVTTLTGEIQACESCDSCRLLKNHDTDANTWAHPDLHVIRKELASFSDDAQIRKRKQMSIPVEIVRQHLIEPAGLAAKLNHGKVFIVDEAELLNGASQNVLLKTLEEPPAGTTIMLITSSEERLLPTIRSRCQRVAFVPLSDEQVGRWLDQQEGSLEAATRDWLIGFADGSLGRAQLALQQDLASWAQVLLPMLEAMAQGQPDAAMGEQLAQRIKAFAESWVKQYPNASKEAANRLGASLGFSILTTHARQHLAQRGTQCSAGALIESQASLDPWLGVIDAVHQAEGLLGTHVNLSLVCDHLMVTVGRCLLAGAREGSLA